MQLLLLEGLDGKFGTEFEPHERQGTLEGGKAGLGRGGCLYVCACYLYVCMHTCVSLCAHMCSCFCVHVCLSVCAHV